MYFILLIFFTFSFFHDCLANDHYTSPLCLKHVTCTKGDKILNDCNWCKCMGGKFLCESRHCANVDMFGHFNDAIQGIQVGMEGHGVWRSTHTPCEPDVQYTRNNTLCICNSMGTWPNPTCRDLFRVLYTVTDTGIDEIKTNQKCTPRKLYLIGCNTCFCPEAGFIDTKLCTDRPCLDVDPVQKSFELKVDSSTSFKEEDIIEVYAECEIMKKYRFGCRKCTCLPNNRLECTKCNTEMLNTRCKNKLNGEVYSVDCNLCFCDHKGIEYCTARQCITDLLRSTLEKKLVGTPDVNNLAIDPVYDFTNCTPGTHFNFGCKTCYCMTNANNTLIVGCNLHRCNKLMDPLEAIEEKCVRNTMYKKNCMICYCEKTDGILYETCKTHRKCVRKNNLAKVKKVKNLPGYCEPLHVYKDNCNECKCLTKGNVLACTSKPCGGVKRSHELGLEANGTVVEVVPITSKEAKECPKGKSYKVNCNVCFCLDNGNAVCSFKKCNK